MDAFALCCISCCRLLRAVFATPVENSLEWCAVFHMLQIGLTFESNSRDLYFVHVTQFVQNSIVIAASL